MSDVSSEENNVEEVYIYENVYSDDESSSTTGKHNIIRFFIRF